MGHMYVFLSPALHLPLTILPSFSCLLFPRPVLFHLLLLSSSCDMGEIMHEKMFGQTIIGLPYTYKHASLRTHIP